LFDDGFSGVPARGLFLHIHAFSVLNLRLVNISPDQTIAGLLAPLFAIRSENDLGIGDVDGLRQLVDWAADIGFELVQLLPINETGNDNSPYNAISSVAIDPTTIFVSPDSLVDLPREDYEAVVSKFDLYKLRIGPVNYPKVKALKRDLLWKAYERFCNHDVRRNTSRAKKFRAFAKEQSGWLIGHTLFRVLVEENDGDERWDKWPEEQRTQAAASRWLKEQSVFKRKELDRKIRFHAYVQWIAFTQWRELKAHCDSRGVALMGDVPYGVSYYSSDVFSQPEIFDLSWSGGAPPEKVFKSDPFTEKWGQNWGIPLYRWDLIRRGGFAWWRQRVQMVREIFHLFRIDHVLGFYRIYSFPWRPQENAAYLPLSGDEARERTGGRLPGFLPREDSSWENREANRREGEEYLRVLLETVGVNRLIGEDLGMVPDYVRPSLASLGIAGFKIPNWEREHDGRMVDGRRYQRLSVATYATHDHPPLRSLWEELNTAAKAGDGHALHEMRCMAGFAGIPGEMPRPYSDAIYSALLAALLGSNSWIAILMITDFLGSAQRFNVPGAIAASNWSERLPETVARMRENPDVLAKARYMHQLLRSTGRHREP
jgi:4-alpha-glucanotransferase